MNRMGVQRLSKDELMDPALRSLRQDKTFCISSKPLSTDRKEKQDNAKPSRAKPGREPHTRKLCDKLDAFEDHFADPCGRYGRVLLVDGQWEWIGEYDWIEIPPVKLHGMRHQNYACRCAQCGSQDKAVTPTVATTAPFGTRIHALTMYCYDILIDFQEFF